MKRIYITPTTLIIKVEEEESMLQSGSGGVYTNCALGNEYSESDVSYTKEESGGIWDREW